MLAIVAQARATTQNCLPPRTLTSSSALEADEASFEAHAAAFATAYAGK